METLSYRQLVGANVRRLRTQHGLSQDDLADQARRFGLDWTQETVAAVEGGRRELAGEEMFRMQTTLPLPELLAPLPGVGVSFGLTANLGPSAYAAAVEGFLAGKPLSASVFGAGDHNPVEDATHRKVDRRLAKSLAVPVLAISQTAWNLWGRGVAEERTRRLEAAGPAEGKSERMRLAWITRQLKEELRTELESERSGKV